MAKPVIAPAAPNRRALILPGGGMRVAYQAGIVSALHEAGLRYSYADGASGGTMNLAALLSGITPDDLCRRWRTLDPMGFVSLRPLPTYLKLPRAGALGDFDGIERHVFPHLGIDLAAVNAAEGIAATFNVCNFADKVVEAVPHHELVRELLLAGISLPLATPAVRYRGAWWSDAVWIRDSNLLAAVRAGANELWVAWCIGNTPDFKPGLLEQYVHMIEMAAIGRFNDELAAIAELNTRIAAGERPYGHETPIVVHVIAPETPLPLDPDYLAGKVDAQTLISWGWRDARRYLAAMTPGGTPPTPAATKMREPGRGVAFRETMRGRITLGESDPARGYRSPAGLPVALHGAIAIDSLEDLRVDPDHRGILAGHIECHRLGGWLPGASGQFGLFSRSPDPALAYMVYAMQIMIDGRVHWFNGRKHVRMAGPWKLWAATTTLYVTLHDGPDANAPIAGAGILRLGPSALMALLGTMQATGAGGLWDRLKLYGGFMRFFVGELVRIYLLRRPAR